MYEVPPALPSRKAIVSAGLNKTADDSLGSKDCSCHSPMALLCQFETSQQSDHKHVFKSFVIEKQNDQQEQEENDAIEGITIQPNNELMDPMEIVNETVVLPSSTLNVNTSVTITTRIICQLCHVWFIVNHTKPNADHSACTGIDYPCHHYHNQGLNVYQCCGCDYTLAYETQEPILSMTLFKRLEATRPKARSYAEMMQQREGQQPNPTLVSTYSTILIYIQDLLSGLKRNINKNNPNFLARVGLNDGSQALLEEIGFRLNDNFFVPSTLDSAAETRLRQIEQEVLVSLDVLRQELGSTTVPFTSVEEETKTKIKTTDMQQLLGIEPSMETRYISTDAYLNNAYASFGLTSGASDRLVEWTYNKINSEPTVLIDSYDAMDSLVTIANYTNSDVLQTLIACERSKGKIGRNDIGDAYAYFGIAPDAADDRLLIGLYQIKMTDEPLEKNTHQDKLKTIAIARNSSELIQFLKEEKGIPFSANTKSVENMMGVPAHMVNIEENVPVGLNNIGNTCYFNSLLQYYNTFKPFRETMIDNELYVEDENSEPKKIGGINVDQSEVRRAKKFVNLLKELFLNLQQTQDKAISPQYDLAYMALLNEKDDIDDNDDSIKVVEQEQEQEQSPANMLNTADADIPEELDDKLTLQKVPDDQPSSDALNRHIEQQEEVLAEETRPNSPPPSYEEITKEERLNNINTHADDKKCLINSETKNTSSRTVKERPSVDAMMFGKQQDVTECMGNVMYLVEAALKPLSKTDDGEQVDDMIRRSFYGKARQILSYRDNSTLKTVKKEMEEDFSHVIVDASEGKDLYDGLDEYFFADQVENFQGGCEVTREVTAKSFPPILQVLVQRVQFDRATSNVYKSNAYIQFYKTIYLDRYADENFEVLKDRRAQVALWRAEMETYKKQVAKYTKSEICKMPIPDLLEASCQVLTEFSAECSTDEDKQKLEQVLQFIKRESEEKKQIIQDGTNKIEELKAKIQSQYDDYKQIAYRLHAVFIHQGQANYGHYWIYILDHKKNQWWKYNDSLVTKVQESEIFHNTTGSTANPYFLVYVDESRMDDYVETIVTRRPDNIIADAA